MIIISEVSAYVSVECARLRTWAMTSATLYCFVLRMG